MAFISVGYKNIVNAKKINAITVMGSSPIKRAVREAKKRSQCIDATEGARTNSVIFLEDGFVILSANMVETILKRLEKNEERND